ncbi:pirin [Leucobacter zeae]|nr:pirin [Leucobacter zeae]
MSNAESHPAETVCEALPAAARTIEILEPRDVPLGGLRAMNVRRTLPQRSRSLIGAWCFLDHYGPDDVAATGGMNVPAHPHIGLQTVSWLFSGEIEHRDSAGFHAFVRPGELNLMTAGHGISHSERSSAATTTLHGAQLWVVLPERARGGPKGFEHYAPEVLRGAGWIAQVFLGSLLGSRSPVTTHTPLLGAEIRLEPGASIDLDLDPAFEHGVLVDSGSASLTAAIDSGASEPSRSGVGKDRLAYLPPGANRLTLTAHDNDGARLLLLGGEPFAERIVMWWNFIGRDHDEVARARRDWQAQIAGAGVGDVSGTDAEAEATAAGEIRDPDPASPRAAETDRFGLPADEPEPPLPAPPLPTARLVPRENPSPHRAALHSDRERRTGSDHHSSHPQEDTVTDTPAETITVRHEPDSHRFAVYVDDALAGFTEYRERQGGSVFDFVHTEVDPAFGGRGLGGTLVSRALAETTGLGKTIVPHCPFVAAWLRKHPEFPGEVSWP